MFDYFWLYKKMNLEIKKKYSLLYAATCLDYHYKMEKIGFLFKRRICDVLKQTNDGAYIINGKSIAAVERNIEEYTKSNLFKRFL